MMGAVPIRIMIPDGGFRTFYDPKWGFFYVLDGDLRREFGDLLPGMFDLVIGDCSSQLAVKRDVSPIVHWAPIDREFETLCGIDSPFRVYLSHEVGMVTCEICKRIARVPAEPYEFVSA